jgi:hypothetical protein
MEQVNATLNAMQSVAPPEVWLALIGGPVNSFITQKFKKWFSVQKSWVVILIVMTVAFLQSVGAYIVGRVTQNPSVLGDWMPIIAFSSVAFYHTIGKPVIGIVEDANTLREESGGDLSGSRISATVAEAAAKATAAGLLPSAESITPVAPANNSDAAEFTAIQ